MAITNRRLAIIKAKDAFRFNLTQGFVPSSMGQLDPSYDDPMIRRKVIGWVWQGLVNGKLWVVSLKTNGALIRAAQDKGE